MDRGPLRNIAVSAGSQPDAAAAPDDPVDERIDDAGAEAAERVTPAPASAARSRGRRRAYRQRQRASLHLQQTRAKREQGRDQPNAEADDGDDERPLGTDTRLGTLGGALERVEIVIDSEIATRPRAGRARRTSGPPRPGCRESGPRPRRRRWRQRSELYGEQRRACRAASEEPLREVEAAEHALGDEQRTARTARQP